MNIKFLFKLKKTATQNIVCYVRCREKAAELLKILLKNNFRGCFGVRKADTEQCVASVEITLKGTTEMQ
jgi:hypothetical protein